MSAIEESPLISPQIGSTMTDTGLERFEFTIGDDVIPFFLGQDCFDAIAKEIIKIGEARPFDKLFIGCDVTIEKFHLPKLTQAFDALGLSYAVCVTKPGEDNKSMGSLDYIINTLLKNGCSRNSIIIPFGGGVVGNMFGLASALLFRGIRFVHVPTTFLSAHDSVTSKKQAINHTDLKNIVGTYYVPVAVFCNVAIFETLNEDNIRSGSGELTKNAVLFGGQHRHVLEPILRRHQAYLKYTQEETLALMRMGIIAKGSLLRHDPKERTTAIIFEYGHTIGHAVELTYGVSHGCAVALGMLAASFISNKLGIMSDADRADHDELVCLLGVKLPRAPTDELQDQVWKRVCGDNKRGYIPLKDGFRPFILAKRVGEMHRPNEFYLEYVPDGIVRASIAYLTTQHYVQDESTPVASKHALKRSSSTSYLSHNASLHLFTELFTAWVSNSRTVPE